MFPKSLGVVDIEPVALDGGFNDTARIAFLGPQNDEKLLI
jgi:hypothetical protein